MPVATRSCSEVEKKDDRLPVTLLSGFLGAGKTTLLEYILSNKDHGLRCAIIVNDIGALNIDASLLSKHNVTQKEEKVVQMQNGCICCTLRGDLLEEIAELAEKKSFDYLIIESTGISEPQQVAETFTAEFSDQMAAEDIEAELAGNGDVEANKKLATLLTNGGLSKISRLDTCVTVVDSTSFLGDLDTTDFLSDRHGDQVTPEDERNITDLMVDQIEFANIILVNKSDLVSKSHRERVRRICETLNPSAKIIETVKSRVDLREILNTNTFSFEEASMGAGWLQSLKEVNRVRWTDSDGKTKMVPKPETEEYGIGSFVYRARRPFHPERFWEMISKPFVVIQNEMLEEVADSDDSDEDSSTEEVDPGEQPQLDLPGRIACKRESPLFKTLHRSKGFVWLATRPKVHGEWSQAGVMFTLTGGTRWLCEEDESAWPLADSPDVVAGIKRDFIGQWGDRRQELVFIGEKLDKEALTKALDEVLLNDAEWAEWEKIMKSRKSLDKKLQRLHDVFPDGFEEWFDPGAEDEAEMERLQAQEAKKAQLLAKKRARLEEEKKHRGHKHVRGGKVKGRRG